MFSERNHDVAHSTACDDPPERYSVIYYASCLDCLWVGKIRENAHDARKDGYAHKKQTYMHHFKVLREDDY